MLKRIIRSPMLYLLGLALGFMQALVFDFSFDSPLVILSPLLSLLSLTGFLWILQDLTPKRALKFGYIFGLGIFTWGINWVYLGLERSESTSTILAMIANTGLIAYLSLYWLIIAYLITKLGKTRMQRLLLAAPVIVLLEWVRSVFFLGFPWLTIGYGWIDTPISEFASFGGVLLVSFIVVSLSASFLLPIPRKSNIILLLSFIFGLFIILAITEHTIDNEKPNKNAIVALVQGNMPVITTYNNERMQENVEVYSALTDKLLTGEKTHNIIIWPESAIPYFHTDILQLQADLQEKQRKQKFDFISGVNFADIKKRQFYNAAMHQTPNTDIADTNFYFKHHLLPFGEYIPFSGLFDFFGIPMASYSKGDLIQKPFVSAGIVFSPSICFEMAFGNEIRQNAINSDVLLNISNDAWFGTSKAQSQHFNITRMRAIENHKPIIRATNNGITAIISADGSVQKSLPQFSRGVLTADINGNNEVTVYAKFGDYPWLSLFTMTLLLISLPSKYYSNKKTNSV